MTDKRVSDLPSLLEPGDLLVVNDTKVLPTRLSGLRGEARIDVTLHKPEGDGVWRAFARPGRRLRVGDILAFGGELTARLTEKHEHGEVTLDFERAEPDLRAALYHVGAMPLPPYIRRKSGPESRDLSDYQTLFAAREGAVAAPTASLHFTPELMAAFAARGIGLARLTLHVGAGTFLPVRDEEISRHKMHSEWGEISAETAREINATRAVGGRTVAVGTTVCRLLESAVDKNGTVHPISGETDIFIRPGYRFGAVDLLLTNFHLPKSTLMMLVSAFSGRERMLSAYRHAVESGYRFFSYGDACLLHPLAPDTVDHE